MLQFDYAVVFLYVMPSEAEAFCCLENFVARCPAFAESNFPGFFQSLKVWYPFLFDSSCYEGLTKLFGSFWINALSTLMLTSMPIYNQTVPLEMSMLVLVLWASLHGYCGQIKLSSCGICSSLMVCTWSCWLYSAVCCSQGMISWVVRSESYFASI